MDEVCSTQPIDFINNDVINKPMDKVPVLSVHVSEKKIMEYPLLKKYVTIGRDPKCDVCIKSSLLSREHAVFELDENYICTVTDLGSLNGTKRNDLHLKPKISYELRDGDCLYFGGIYCTLKFCLSSSTSLCLVNPLHKDSKSLELSLQKTNQDTSCHLHHSQTENQLSLQSNFSTKQNDDSDNNDDSDCSVFSERLLAEIVVNTGEVSHDLLPNPDHFINSYSPSLSSSTDSDVKKTEMHESPSSVENCKPHVHNKDDVHLESESNQNLSTTESVSKSKGYIIDATPLQLLSKSIKNNLSSNDVIPATPMVLTNKTSSTPLTYNRVNVLLARDSDPGCIVQSMDNHFELTIRSSTCLSTEESVFTIEESDLVTSNAAKSIGETSGFGKDEIILNKSNVDLTNNNNKFAPNFTRKSTLQPVNQSVISDDSLQIVVDDNYSSRKSRIFNGICPEKEEKMQVESTNSCTTTTTPTTTIIDTKKEHCDLITVNSHNIVCKNITVTLQPLENLQNSNCGIHNQDDQFLNNSSISNKDQNIHSDSPSKTDGNNSSERKADIVFSQEWGSDIVHTEILSEKVQYNNRNNYNIRKKNTKSSRFASSECNLSGTDYKVNTITKQKRRNLKSKDQLSMEKSVESPLHVKQQQRLTISELAKTDIPQSTLSSKSDLTSERIQLTPDDNDCKLRRYIEHCSLFRSTRSTRNRPSERVTNCILPGSLGTVKFRSRKNKQNSTSVISSIHLDSPNSDAELQDWKCSWSLINHDNDVNYNTKKVNNQSNYNRRRAPHIPSPLHLSGSILSEEPSQLFDEKLEQTKNESNISPSKTNNSSTKTINNSIHRNESCILESAVKLAGFDESPENDPLVKNTLNIGESLSLPSFTDLTPNSFNAKICIEAKSSNEQQQFSPLLPTSTLPITSLSDEYTSSPVLMKPKRNLRNSCTTRKKAFTSLTTSSVTNNDVDNDSKDYPVHKNANNNNKVGRTSRTLSSIPKENNLSLPTDKTTRQNSRKSKLEVNNDSSKLSIRRSTRFNVQSDGICNKAPLAVSSTLQQHIRPVVSIPEDRCCSSSSSRRIGSSALINLNEENPAKNQRKRRMTTSTNESKGKNPKISNTDFNNTSSTSGSSKTNTTNSIQLIFSGVESSSYSNVLKKLNAFETEDPTLADYLITDQIKRTLKVLYARARGIPIISVEWLKACKQSRKGSNPDPLNFKLDYYNTQSIQTTVPSRQSTRLSSLIKLSENEQKNQFEETNKFLCGWSFCSTPNVLPSSMDLQKLTEFAGGYWMSDEDLCNVMMNLDDSPIKTVIITTKEEYHSMLLLNSKPSCKTSRLSKNSKEFKQISPISRALSSLLTVSTDWFLQTIMNRKPPIWPIDPQYKIQ
uniref:Mediator of DNA damage checkpoint protein 1 n=1 Tax=Schistosoma mansoni TaxID=6183 RepID=A0A3Q0KLT3_SCHMA